MRSITWIFCLGHAGFSGNEAADKLAGEAVVGDKIVPDRAEVLEKLSEHLRKEEDTEAQSHYAIERMQELGVTRGEGRKSRLAGKERKIWNQTATGTISVDTLETVLMRGTEHLWTCPQCNDVMASTKV